MAAATVVNARAFYDHQGKFQLPDCLADASFPANDTTPLVINTKRSSLYQTKLHETKQPNNSTAQQPNS